MEKLEWLGYPTVKKISKICLFVLTEYANVTDTQTDTQTPHDGIGRACIASRGKNDVESCCHKQDLFTDAWLSLLVSRDKQTSPLSAITLLHG